MENVSTQALATAVAVNAMVPTQIITGNAKKQKKFYIKGDASPIKIVRITQSSGLNFGPRLIWKNVLNANLRIKNRSWGM